MNKEQMERIKLSAAVEYDPATGYFFRNGNRAERKHPRGYVYVCYGSAMHLAHRAAWMAVNGPIPKGMVIDHVNRNPTDNRIANLRMCSMSENASNRKPRMSTNTSGFRGVSRQAGKWIAYITHQGQRTFLGYHETREDAFEAHLKERIRLFGEFA